MKSMVSSLIIPVSLLLSTWCLAFNIELPPDKSIIAGSSVSVVIALEKGEVDNIRVFVNSRNSREKAVKGNVASLCLHVALDYGLNTLEIQGLLGGSINARKTIHVYYQGRLVTNTASPPAMFSPYVFHVPANERTCCACHQLDPTVKDFTPGTPESSSCHSCHSVQAKGVHIHYPVQKGFCLFCHQAGNVALKYKLLEDEQNYCFICHSGRIKKWKSQPVIHGPVAKGQCSLCHDPHSSPRNSLLRLHTTDLCITCHEDKATGAHVISGFYGKGHPVRGVRNPLNPEQEFTCAGCHNPHAGLNRDLLRHDREKMTEYCILCHNL